MSVFAVLQVPTVYADGFDEPVALDLVAHFLGIASHHNDNVAPRHKLGQKPWAPSKETF